MLRAAKGCGTMTQGNGHLPTTPYSGNGDLGAAVEGSGACGEVQISLGLNQLWMINRYWHWALGLQRQPGLARCAPDRSDHVCADSISLPPLPPRSFLRF